VPLYYKCGGWDYDKPWAGCTKCVKGAKCVEQNGMGNLSLNLGGYTNNRQNGTTNVLPTTKISSLGVLETTHTLKKTDDRLSSLRLLLASTWAVLLYSGWRFPMLPHKRCHNCFPAFSFDEETRQA